MDDWIAARHSDALREILLRDDRYLPLALRRGAPTEALIGVKIRDLGFPSGCLIAIVRRGREALIPSGEMVLEFGDRLTVIGEVDGIAELKQRFTGQPNKTTE